MRRSKAFCYAFSDLRNLQGVAQAVMEDRSGVTTDDLRDFSKPPELQCIKNAVAVALGRTANIALSSAIVVEPLVPRVWVGRAQAARIVSRSFRADLEQLVVIHLNLPGRQQLRKSFTNQVRLEIAAQLLNELRRFEMRTRQCC
jgi:hypothetical protein